MKLGENSETAAVDLTLMAASDDELRQRAANGDQRALAELTRRQMEAQAWTQAA